MQRHRLVVLTPLLLIAVAFLARSLSLQWSSLPYNIDGLSELRVAQDILSTNHLDFSPGSSHSESYVVDMPLLGLVIAFLSSLLGVDPVHSSQLTTALIGSVAVSIGYLLLRQHWRSHRAAVSSALVLALVGSFVFSAGCVWKETLGLTLILLVLYAYPLRQSTNHRLLMTIPLPLLVFTHHHATVVAFVMLTFAVVMDLASRPRKTPLTRTEHMDILTVLSSWGLAVVYYDTISLPYLDYLSPKSDLYLYLAVAFLVLLVAVKMSVSKKPITELPIELSVPMIGAAIMVYNFYHPLFPGIPAPASLIAVPFLAYLIIVVPAWGGAGLVLRTRGPSKNLLLAMVLGPLSLIIFAFVRSTDAMSHEIVFRTFDFLMPALAVFVGLGFAFIVKGRERLGMLVGACFVVILASTLPVAYSSQELFGVENQTYQYEYDAVEWLSMHGVDSYTSDQRLGETGWRLFDIEYGRGLPYTLSEGLALNGSSFYLLEEQWSTDGAQEFPFGTVVVSHETISQTLDGSSVVYIGGSVGGQLVLLRTQP